MTTEQRTPLVDGGLTLSLTRGQEDTLLCSEAIYYCEKCRVYHIDPDYNWSSIAQVLAEDCEAGDALET